jgi:hypothetical protein
MNLAALAEGVATDARGNLTLVAVNPQFLVTNDLPVQFAPFFIMIVEDDGREPIEMVPGHTLTAKVEAKGPDDAVVFFTQMRQMVATPSNSAVRGRIQVLAQIPFTAAKTGAYTISADLTFLAPDGEPHAHIEVSRSVNVIDVASLRPRTS